MKWTKSKTDPMRDFYIDGEDGWRICKTYPGPVYVLSRSGKLVKCGRDLDELKRRADEDCNDN
ncbi:hypothetical protein LF41_2398 [Lysobacter dokdonensis DS-58]|uniref:Uncharacterized protein n=2 Tax=Noviluteimonas TaxID=3382693 RepID=A0A0A2WI76_9GAMM|nr:hypothetical protein LF41_2398 [Lysobacter dokdonensis DS-58]